MELRGGILRLIALVAAGVLIVIGTILQWTEEKDLGYTTNEQEGLFRFSQLLFWFVLACAICSLFSHSPFFVAIISALLFAIIAVRRGDGVVSLERVDFYRIKAQEGGNGDAFDKAVGGSVLTYAGALGCFFASLPEFQLQSLKTRIGIVYAVALVLGLIGCIVLWTSDWISLSDAVTRLLIFDTTAYTLWALIYAGALFLCNAQSVLITIAFYCGWIVSTQFAVMFQIQEIIRSQNQGDTSDAVWAGYILCWLSMLVVLALVGYEMLLAPGIYTSSTTTTTHKKTTRSTESV